MTLTFPILPGQGWSVHKKPKFSTLVASHVSGREVRAPQWQNPLWEFEATFDALASDSVSYPGLGAQSLQTLMGLFLQCQGQFATFTYMDPTDYLVAGQGFGTGDGATTAFQLSRSLGGFLEPILAPYAATGLTLTTIPPGPGGKVQYAPNNLLTNGNSIASGLPVGFSATITGGQTDPNGGNLAGLFAEQAATAVHYLSQTVSAIAAGVPVTFSVYLLQGTSRYCQINIDNPGPAGAWANIDMQTGAVTASGIETTVLAGPIVVVTPAGGGWFRASISLIPDSVSTSCRIDVIGINSPTAGFAPSYLGNAANNFKVAFPQVEQAITVGAPSAYNPTLATPFYGGPSVTIGGAYVDPSTYGINASTGVITFATAPAATAVLKWSGWFSFICRFLDDIEDFEQSMQNLWTVKSVKFQSVR